MAIQSKSERISKSQRIEIKKEVAKRWKEDTTRAPGLYILLFSLCNASGWSPFTISLLSLIRSPFYHLYFFHCFVTFVLMPAFSLTTHSSLLFQLFQIHFLGNEQEFECVFLLYKQRSGFLCCLKEPITFVPQRARLSVLVVFLSGTVAVLLYSVDLLLCVVSCKLSLRVICIYRYLMLEVIFMIVQALLSSHKFQFIDYASFCSHKLVHKMSISEQLRKEFTIV